MRQLWLAFTDEGSNNRLAMYESVILLALLALLGTLGLGFRLGHGLGLVAAGLGHGLGMFAAGLGVLAFF